MACGMKPLRTEVGDFRQADVAQTSPYAQQPLPMSCGHRKELVEQPLGQHAEYVDVEVTVPVVLVVVALHS